MAKKEVKVAYDSNGYDRVRLGKQEHVTKYIKEIEVPELSKETKKRIKQGKAKRLLPNQEDIKDFALLAYEFEKRGYGPYDKELSTKLNTYLHKYDYEISQWVTYNVDKASAVHWYQKPILYYEGVYRKKIDINDYIANTKTQFEFQRFDKLTNEIIKGIKAENNKK